MRKTLKHEPCRAQNNKPSKFNGGVQHPGLRGNMSYARINCALGVNNCTNIHLMLSSRAEGGFTLGC